MHRIQPDLSVAIASLVLRNPVIIASGVFGYGQEYNGLVDVHQIGAIITKGISLQPSQGNPPPRIVETLFSAVHSYMPLWCMCLLN